MKPTEFKPQRKTYLVKYGPHHSSPKNDKYKNLTPTHHPKKGLCKDRVAGGRWRMTGGGLKNADDKMLVFGRGNLLSSK